MTITIAFGWWLLPLMITVVGIGWSFIRLGFCDPWDIFAPFVFLLSIIASLVAWLIWAVAS